jgi:UDP-glucose:glycoprotein glucosyltransferase
MSIVSVYLFHVVGRCQTVSVGQCFDVSSDQPTPGLEFVLGSSTVPDLYDTIVMANLGYFQLKASPGAFTLRLREGRSNNIYYVHRSTI